MASLDQKSSCGLTAYIMVNTAVMFLRIGLYGIRIGCFIVCATFHIKLSISKSVDRMKSEIEEIIASFLRNDVSKLFCLR